MKPFSQRALQGHRSALVFAEDSELPKYVITKNVPLLPLLHFNLIFMQRYPFHNQEKATSQNEIINMNFYFIFFSISTDKDVKEGKRTNYRK
jgi:hypothetical protein